jgi:hypothetical protein
MKSLQTLLKTVLLLAVTTSGLLHSCSDPEPKRVAQQFLQLYYIEKDFIAAASVSTEATIEGLTFTAMLFEFDPGARLDNFESFKITDMKVQKSRAICYYEVDGTKRRLLLSKKDGQWLVDMPGEVTRSDRNFSLSLSPPNSGGFASAESEMTRIGDVPEKKR